MLSAVGVMKAAISPCAARALISITLDWLKPQVSDAREKSATAVMKSRRRPNTSAVRPPRRRKPPNASE